MPTKKKTSDPASEYANGTDAQKKAILTRLRDTDRMAWRDVAKTLGLGAPGPQGKFYGAPARTAYTKYVRPHTESVVFEGVGRPRGSATKKQEPAKKATATRKAPAKKAAAKRTSGTKVTDPAPEAQPSTEAAS